MSEYCWYSDEDRVIYLDLPTLNLTSAVVEKILTEMVAIIQTQPKKAYTLVKRPKYGGRQLTKEETDQVSRLMQQLLQYATGLFFYDTEETTSYRAVETAVGTKIFSDQQKSKEAALVEVNL